MLVLITYDVNVTDAGGARRLRKVAKICENHGIRVQNSVFECNINASQRALLKSELLKIINEKQDSLRFYNLGNNYYNKVEHYGVKNTFDMKEVIVL